MAVFTPPADNVVSPIALGQEDSKGPQSDRLFRYYKPRARGRNVYQLTNGVITEDQPFTTYNADGTPNTEAWLRVAHVWYGGHPETVTAAQQAALIAAGYGAYIV